jgi:hypothetical protein
MTDICVLLVIITEHLMKFGMMLVAVTIIIIIFLQGIGQRPVPVQKFNF